MPPGFHPAQARCTRHGAVQCAQQAVGAVAVKVQRARHAQQCWLYAGGRYAKAGAMLGRYAQ